ncbi:hypothetical protein ACFVUP_39220 [Streptomyces bacillaris]|uniref:hypothetical protein n=1 Tax=Streptomyces bacillaris TaxID=68179 RepID=UPI0036D80859
MEEYDWGVRFHELNEIAADSVVAFGETIGFEGFTSDPHSAYESLLDRDGVVLFSELVEAALGTEVRFSNEERWGGENTLEETPDWLEFADRVNHPVPEWVRNASSFGWGVKLMGLTEGGAAMVSTFAAEHGMRHVVIDPSKWQELGVDRPSVEIDQALIRLGLASGALFTTEERERAAAMLKGLDRWLEQAVRLGGERR